MFLVSNGFSVSVLFLCCSSVFADFAVFSREELKEVQLQMVYWTIKPFFFRSQDNNSTSDLHGLIPALFRIAALKCLPDLKTDFVDYKVNLVSRRRFEAAFRNYTHHAHGQGLLKDITKPHAVIWGPENSVKAKSGHKHIIQRNLTVQPVLTSERLVIVQPRHNIEKQTKFIRGIWNCRMGILFGVMFAFSFGLAIWMVERSKNSAFKNLTGPGSGLYFSFVTMSTVGYGDIVPVTFIGRAMTVVWMFLSMLLAAVITATLTDTLSGTKGLEIEGKDVAVIRESYEENIIGNDYSANPIPYDSYEEVIEGLRNGEVFAAAIPYEIASWMQSKIRDPHEKVPLSFVYTLPGKVNFNIYFAQNPFPKSNEVFECIFSDFKAVIFETTLAEFHRNIILQTDYHSSLADAATELPLFYVASLLTLSLIFITLTFVVYRYLRKDENKQHKEAHRQISDVEQSEKRIDETIKLLQLMLEKYYSQKMKMKLNNIPNTDIM